MSTIFIGGSRQVSQLSSQAKERLCKVVRDGHRVVVGDANGADKAVQKYLLDVNYEAVTVFCSGEAPRNNLGLWNIRRVEAPQKKRDFQFYAAKDREMVRAADYGLMIWDGESPGTVLNVLRLVQAGKTAFLVKIPERSVNTFKYAADWESFLSACSVELQEKLKERATRDEWHLSYQSTLIEF